MWNRAVVLTTLVGCIVPHILGQTCTGDGCDTLVVSDLYYEFSMWQQASDCNSDGLHNMLDYVCLLNIVPDFHPPILDPIGHKAASRGETILFTVTATDPDEDPLTFATSQLPPEATYDYSTNEFSLTLNQDHEGVYPVTFSVHDGFFTVSEEIKIIVSELDAVIGSSGGMIEMTDPSHPLFGLRIVIPPGALTEDTLIAMAQNLSTPPLEEDIEPGLMIFELVGPDWFQIPAEVSFPIVTLPASFTEILNPFRLNEETNQWEFVFSFDLDHYLFRLLFETHEFSTWTSGISETQTVFADMARKDAVQIAYIKLIGTNAWNAYLSAANAKTLMQDLIDEHNTMRTCEGIALVRDQFTQLKEAHFQDLLFFETGPLAQCQNLADGPCGNLEDVMLGDPTTLYASLFELATADDVLDHVNFDALGLNLPLTYAHTGLYSPCVYCFGEHGNFNLTFWTHLGEFRGAAFGEILANRMLEQSCGVTCSVTVSSGTGGTTDKNGTNAVPCGDSLTVTAIPDYCHSFSSWSGDISGTSENPLTISNITGNLNITANFSVVNTRTVTISSTAGGSTNYDGTNVINCGDSLYITASPNAGYFFAGWSGDIDSLDNPLDLINISEDMNFTANFILVANIHIPDANFKSFLVTNYDTSGDGEISNEEAAAVLGSMKCGYRSIADLTGIEHFVNLTGLECESNQLTSINTSANKRLEDLICFSNQLTSLDVTLNNKLKYLWCHQNQLTALNVSMNPDLITIGCSTNHLTALNVTANTKLTNLNCSDNSLTFLNVDSNTALKIIGCSNNQLITLNLSQNTLLEQLDCQSNQLTALDLSSNTSLMSLLCGINQLSGLNVSNNTQLTILSCYSNQLSALDVSNNTLLIELSCFNNQLTSLNISSQTSLQKLSCEQNQIPALDLSHNTLLEELSCDANQLTRLDLSVNTALTHIACHSNQLSDIPDVTGCSNLTTYDCKYNYFGMDDCPLIESIAGMGLSEFIYNPQQDLSVLDCSCYKSVTVQSGPGGSTDRDGVNIVSCGGSLTITAESDSCHTFAGWTGDASGYTNPLVLNNINSDLNITATFTPETRNVNVVCVPETGGTTDKNGLNIVNCGDSLSIHASPAACYSFDGWSGDATGNDNPIDITNITSDLTVFANFVENNTPEVTVLSTTGGSTSHDGVNPVPCGGSLTITASPDYGYEFLEWTGGATGSNNPLNLTDISFDMELTAHFIQVSYINIPDANFKTFLVANYDTSGEGEISTREAEAVTGTMDCHSLNIADLTGIEHFFNLSGLNCSGNSLSDLNVSANTGLTTLDCHDNNLSDVPNISACASLHSFWCHGNSFTLEDCIQIQSIELLGLTVFQYNPQGDGSTLDCSCIHSINVSSNPGGSTDHDGITVVHCGDDLTITATPDSGFTFTGWSGDITSMDNPLELLNITSDISITANFDLVANINIPDTQFKNFLVANYDTSGDGEISTVEAQAVTGTMNCSYQNIADLTGIEHFTNLTGLYCNSNLLTALDVSSCASLVELNCHINQITTIHVNGCSNLTHLYSSNNQLSTLDLSSNTGLVYLECGFNQLVSLDVSPQVNMTHLYCQYNQLNNLNLGTNTALITLMCSSNQLTSLDISNCTNLVEFECNSNQLGSIDVSGFTSLSYLGCDQTSLTSLDITGCTSLATLYCSDNQLSNLDASTCTSLNTLVCANNQLNSLQVNASSTLSYINCYFNSITSLDVSNHTVLSFLNCAFNQLSSLNTSGCTNLTTLNCIDNSLTALDISTNTSLDTLYCGSNQLSSLDASACTNMSRLDCGSNLLASLTLGANTAMTELYCGDNQMTSLNISDLTGLIIIDCSYNQLSSLNLSANTVLATVYCQNNEFTSLDLSSLSNLATLYCNNNQLSSLNLANNTNLTTLSCGANPLTTLDVTLNTQLTELHCSYNQLSSLDVSFNTALAYLFCGYNNLTSLDLSNNTNLTILNCGTNQLTTLDVSQNTNLTRLDCYNNQLTTLDVSANTGLTQLHVYTNDLTDIPDVTGCSGMNNYRCQSNYFGPDDCALIQSIQAMGLATFQYNPQRDGSTLTCP